MKVAVVRNRKNQGVINRFGVSCPEVYGRKSVQRLMDALRTHGHTVKALEGDCLLLSRLQQFMPPDADGRPTGMVFNLAYGMQGECRYTHVPAMLEMAGVPYTGSTPLGHALALDKVITKRLLQAAGIPTPRFCLMRRGDEPLHGLRFPLVVKPRHESTSYGLQLVHNRHALARAVRAVVSQYRQEALVEAYIAGREICVGLLGNAPVETLPFVEIDFGDRDTALLTRDDKYHKSVAEPEKRCPARVSDSLATAVRIVALATFHACQCRDYARVDIRVDATETPYVLEINSMASLGAGGSYVLAAQEAGYDFDTLVHRLLDVAHERYFGRPAPQDRRTWVAS